MIIGTKAVDETRFQFTDSHNSQTAMGNSTIPGIDVSSTFNSGGSPFVELSFTNATNSRTSLPLRRAPTR